MAENNTQISHASHIISLENAGLSSIATGKAHRINSPRSLEALDRLGYNIDELQYLDLKQFKLNHPEVLNLPENVVKSRYDYYEKRRAIKLDEAMKVSLKE